MRLNEISMADEIPKISMTDINVNNSILFTSHNEKDIYIHHFKNNSIFFISDNNKIAAYIFLENTGIDNRFPLVRMENIGPKGLITTILNGLLAKGISFLIKDTEALTPEGVNWIKKLILKKDPTILITDQNNDPINLNKLQDEYQKAFISSKYDAPKDRYIGPTAILISKI